jgi:hypothetical protein
MGSKSLDWKPKKSWTLKYTVATFSKILMSLSLITRKLAVCLGLAVLPASLVCGQSPYVPQGGEYPIAPSLPGDQIYPALSVNASGGYLVWHDNITDGSGYGVSALRLDGNFSPVYSTFRVNEQTAGDQDYAQVSILNNGGAAFVWQGGPQGFQKIYARFMSAQNTWLTGEFLVNSFTNGPQAAPVVATLANGNVIVAWESYYQISQSAMRDVYFAQFTPAGAKIGAETLVNQTTDLNQRAPAIAPLSDGRFVVVWISESQPVTDTYRVDVYARIFGADGQPAGNEFIVNTGTRTCSNPTVAASTGGGFLVSWAEKDVTSTDSMDIYCRPFSGSAAGGSVQRVNTYTYGDQYAPRASFAGGTYLVVWTSLAQDGSKEGVFGRFLNSDGSAASIEFRVNSTTALSQEFPAVASDGTSRFLVAWSGNVGGINSMDLFAQRYSSVQQPLAAPGAPYVNVLSGSSLAVSWAQQVGFNIANYEVYLDGSVTPTAVVTNNWWTSTGLAAGSAHSYQFDYVLADGRRSPLSPSTSGTTYAYPFTWGGIPYDWMMQYYGSDTSLWPSANADTDGDGATTLQEFLAGTNPTDRNSALKVALSPTPQGLFLNWNSTPGLVYQVQGSATIGVWMNLGQPRVAAGASDSMYVDGSGYVYFRIVRVR